MRRFPRDTSWKCVDPRVTSADRNRQVREITAGATAPRARRRFDPTCVESAASQCPGRSFAETAVHQPASLVQWPPTSRGHRRRTKAPPEFSIGISHNTDDGGYQGQPGERPYQHAFNSIDVSSG